MSLLDFFGFLGVFVEFYDSENSEKLDNPNCSCCCPWCFRLRGQLCYRRGGWCVKDEITDKVDIEYDRDRRDDVEEKEEREEIVLYDYCTQDDFYEENHHDNQTDDIEKHIFLGCKEGCSKVIWEKRIDRQDGDDDLVF